VQLCSITKQLHALIVLHLSLLLRCRDLAEQTHKCFQAYGKYLTAPALSSVLLVGGLDAGAQLKALKQGGDGGLCVGAKHASDK
jgi:superfamily II DNA/RNA helicase